jgi:Ulp1 family protease
VIPIGNGCHWTVAVALMKEHRIVLIDSLAGGESEARQLDHELLVEYFQTKGCGQFNVADVKVSTNLNVCQCIEKFEKKNYRQNSKFRWKC